jgi:hypothetical protein
MNRYLLPDKFSKTTLYGLVNTIFCILYENVKRIYLVHQYISYFHMSSAALSDHSSGMRPKFEARGVSRVTQKGRIPENSQRANIE